MVRHVCAVVHVKECIHYISLKYCLHINVL